MGGRGASSGRSDKGNAYGSQYNTVLTDGNVKFVEANPGSEEQLLETMTKGRVYVLVKGDSIKNIVYFDNELKRTKRIDLDHSHQGMQPHVQHGYYSNEKDKANGVKAGATRLNPAEEKKVARVRQLWDNYRNK